MRLVRMVPGSTRSGHSCDLRSKILMNIRCSLLRIGKPRLLFSSFARAESKAKKPALLLFSVAVLLAGGSVAVRGQSALDGFDPNANDCVNVVVVQPDGKILLGGEFTTLSANAGAAVTRNRIARLNPDGTLDTAFIPEREPFRPLCLFNRGARGRQSFSGRQFLRHRRTAALRPRPARCHHRIADDSFDPNTRLHRRESVCSETLRRSSINSLPRQSFGSQSLIAESTHL
jgi:Domain of unknown function (DUF5122) beta-propeller